MASKQLSPAAQLLRHSKLFSLPPALPRPVTYANGGASVTFDSDKMTTYHPTHAAITTTKSGRRKGDWGFKRNLPLKTTTRSTTAVVRVSEVDSIDHITDFESAADHVLTLRKYQELNLPINRARKGGTKTETFLLEKKGQTSVFDIYENTQDSSNLSRWKFNGPWLAGMTNLEFNNYVEKQIKSRRVEFRKYLKSWMLEEKQNSLQSKQLGDGGLSSETPKATLSSEEYRAGVIRLRQEGYKLWEIIWNFLDLPGAPPSEYESYAEGPPVTHPSAGLSYLRTASHLANHPVLGPQLEVPPVIGRLLGASTTEEGGGNVELVGIGGIVAKHSSSGMFRERGVQYDDKHPKKQYYRPTNVSMDSQGRINMEVTPASKQSIAIWENKYQKVEVKEAKEEAAIRGSGDQGLFNFGQVKKRRPMHFSTAV
jgi:hypothetical protein